MKYCKKTCMIRFANLVLILITVFFIVSCSGDTKNSGAGKGDSSKTNGQAAKDARKDQANLEIVATDICDCVSNYESELSDDAKDKIMHADKNAEVDTAWKLLSP